MGFFGNLLGSAGGQILGGALGGALGGQKGASTGANIGGQLGRIAGDIIPFKKGGMVRKTGVAKLHAGEMVVPKAMVKKVPKSLKKEIKRKGGRNM